MTEAESRNLPVEADGQDAESAFYMRLALSYDKQGKRVKRSEKGMTRLLAKVEEGNPEALLEFSDRLFDGDCVRQNKEKAVKVRYLAAKEGNMEAQFKCGRMYEWGEVVKRDGALAMKWYLLAAEQGHLDAMFALGRMLYMGDLIAKNCLEGEAWLRRAAEGGSDRAQFMLGHMYVTHEGVWLDQSDARKWWVSLAGRRSAGAPRRLDFNVSIRLPAPDIGPEGMPKPGKIRSGLARNLAGAAMLRNVAAILKSAPAEYIKNGEKSSLEERKQAERLRVLTEALELARADIVRAAPGRLMGLAELLEPEMEELRAEAKAGAIKKRRPPKTAAEIIMAVAVIIWPEVEKLRAEAKAETAAESAERKKKAVKYREEGEYWLGRAAAQDHAESQFVLGRLYYLGISGPKDLAETAKWWRLAAEQGHVLAQFFLGVMYGPSKLIPRPDEGADESPVTWQEWFRRAAKQGHVRAQTEMFNMMLRKETKYPNPRALYPWLALLEMMVSDEEAISRRREISDKLSYALVERMDKQVRRLYEKILLRVEEWKAAHYELWGPCAQPPYAWWRLLSDGK